MHGEYKLALTPHHTHNEPDPHGKEEEAMAPYEVMRHLQGAAQKILTMLCAIAEEVGANDTHDGACAAHDAVGDIIIGDPE